MADKPVIRAWTAVVSSFGEATAAIEEIRVAFPLIAVPWGVEREHTACRYFAGQDEMAADALAPLFEEAWPHEGKRKLHLIHTKSVYPSTFIYREQ